MNSAIKDITALQPSSDDALLVHCRDIKDHVLNIVIKASKKEQTGLGRSVALNCLGCFLYQELQKRKFHSQLLEAVNVLIAGIRVSQSIVYQLAKLTVVG